LICVGDEIVPERSEVLNLAALDELVKMEQMKRENPEEQEPNAPKTYGTLIPRVYADYDFGFTMEDVMKGAKEARAQDTLPLKEIAVITLDCRRLAKKVALTVPTEQAAYHYRDVPWHYFDANLPVLD
jgi:hypothetical protein